MSVVLPKEIAYQPSLPALPECTSTDIVLAPINGGTFNPGGMPQFDLLSRGFIDPQSLYIRYTVDITGATGAAVKGTPVYSFFSKLETIFGSSVVENINNYHQVCNMMTQLQMDVAMKYGTQTSLGYLQRSGNSPFDPVVPNLEQLDGRMCILNDSFTLAAPLPCLLSSAERLIPAGHMPNIRIQLTCASIADAFLSLNAPTNYTIRNIELCYTMIDFAGGVNDMVKEMGETIFIKSQSYKNTGTTLSGFAGGNVELVYNLRLASIKSLFTNFCANSNNNVNGLFDSVDLTSSSGEYSYNIGGVTYPTRPVSTLNNKASVLMELKKAVGALHSESYNTSINHAEFNAVDATITSLNVPGKFYFSCNTEKLSSSGVLLSGCSTQNSPITLRIQSSVAATKSYTVFLTALHDVLIAVQPEMRQASVRE